MFPLLLVIIYLSFISLGLPDSLLGSAWPVMYKELNVPLSYSGIIFMIVTLGTAISSLNSERIINKLGTGKVTFISVLLTAFGMLGFSFSHAFFLLCILAIPYGLGAGSVDAALNNYVAIHYESSHMSWLHCMWGVGASVGPYIMSAALNHGKNWNKGYRIISYLQFGLTLILFFSLPLWNKKKNNSKEIKKGKEEKEIKEIDSLNNSREEKEENEENEENERKSQNEIYNSTNNLVSNNENSKGKNESSTSILIEEEKIEETEPEEKEEKEEILGIRKTIKLSGAKEAAIFFFCYCAVEQTIGLWASSYLVLERNINEVTASKFASLFYIGITVGRGISGFVTFNFNDNQMIYLGEGIIFVGIIMILLSFSNWISLMGLIISGLGCAPLYPCMIHATPTNFSKEKSQAVIGVEMASGSIGVLLMPPLFGLLSKWIGIKILPYYLIIIFVIMVIMHYRIAVK